MSKHETVAVFFKHRGIVQPANSQFNVFESDGYCREPMLYNRRDFYKISFLLGSSKLSWRDEEIIINKPALAFFDPHSPYAWSPLSEEQPGYFCLFKNGFLPKHLLQDALFRTPVFFLTKTQQKTIGAIFRHMLAEINSDYEYKYELLKAHLQLLIHEGLKMRPAAPAHHTAAERITAQFLELLERQYPIDSPDRVVPLRTASDFAAALAVHVNHLNHAVKAVTGKPTSVHISDRTITEAKALLKHTNWTVAQIAWSLGFEYPTYFHNFFKKKTGHAAKMLRSQTL